MGTLSTLLLGRALWWAGSGEGEAVGTVPALLLPNPQRESSGLGPGMALHENKAPEPQPLSCRRSPCCLEVGLTLNTEVFSLQRTAAPALNVCQATRPGSMAPSPARGNLALRYLVVISPRLDVLPPASHSTEIVAVHQHNKNKQLHIGIKEQDLLCGAWALRMGSSSRQQPGVAVHTFTYTIFFPPTALLPYLNASMSFFN